MQTSTVTRAGMTWAIRVLVVAAVFAHFSPAHALCLGQPEDGRWKNVDVRHIVHEVDVRPDNCETSVGTPKIWFSTTLKLSSGELQRRPRTLMTYRQSNGHRWLHGRAVSGGRVDQIWLRAASHHGRKGLFVYIKTQHRQDPAPQELQLWFRR